MRLTKECIIHFTRVSQEKSGQLKIEILLDVTPCRWVSSSGRFERYAEGKTGPTDREHTLRNVGDYSSNNTVLTSRKIRIFSNTALACT